MNSDYLFFYNLKSTLVKSATETLYAYVGKSETSLTNFFKTDQYVEKELASSLA
jgi:hypothetical protein